MKTKLVIFILFAIYSCTDSFVIVNNSSDLASKSNTTPKISNCDDNVLSLENIRCMTDRDHEQLWNGLFKNIGARMLNNGLIHGAVTLIGTEELRRVLNISTPLGPHNDTRPSREEIVSASTLDDYFNLRDQHGDFGGSVFNEWFYDHHFTSAIQFLDKRVPEIRSLFRCKLQKEHGNDEVVNRKKIDKMQIPFWTIHDKIDKAIYPMVSPLCHFFKNKTLTPY